MRHRRDDGAPGVTRRHGRSLLPSGSPGHYGSALPARRWCWNAHGFLKPSILIYEPQANGSLALVAVENLAFAAAWRGAGHTNPPTFHGVAFDSMVDDPNTTTDEAHMFAPHYDRHVWLYRDNPRGVFAPSIRP